ncbi:MAG: hypothetical protein ACRD26_07855, partial [Vicinamibacterales bacterium]
MTRTLLAVLPCLGLASTSAFAAGPPSVDSQLRHYDASDVAEGKDPGRNKVATLAADASRRA